jgi:hypothetical protein
MQYGALYGVVCALQRSLQIKQQLLGADDPELLTTISNIADIYREQVRRKRPRRNTTSQHAMSSPEHAAHRTNMRHAAHTVLAASQDTIFDALIPSQAQPLSTAVHWRVLRSNPTALTWATRRTNRAAVAQGSTTAEASKLDEALALYRRVRAAAMVSLPCSHRLAWPAKARVHYGARSAAQPPDCARDRSSQHSVRKAWHGTSEAHASC